MSKLTEKEIWVLRPTRDDVQKGVKYATLTLPWTFNRMMKNTSAAGQRDRAFNIVKGVVNQAILARELRRRGVAAQQQIKSHRDDDLFDFQVVARGQRVRLDVKSGHYYTNYPRDVRSPLSPSFIMRNAGYAGSDWRRFFPMLVPHTQINQEKEAYCFAIASSVDFRASIEIGRSWFAITAFPFGASLPFLSNRRLCLAREASESGIWLNVEHTDSGLFTRELELEIVGEWRRDVVTYRVPLRPGRPKRVGPLACVSAFRLDHENFRSLHGTIEISISKNALRDPVLDSARRNINVEPDEVLELSAASFANLVLPDDYNVYFLGWLPKAEFLERCGEYRSWVWPQGSVDPFANQPWSQVTERDLRMLEGIGFAGRVQEGTHRIRAGLLKTTGRGSGACCYVYPNIGMGGGVRETNLYVLPQDLLPMSTLGS